MLMEFRSFVMWSEESSKANKRKLLTGVRNILLWNLDLAKKTNQNWKFEHVKRKKKWSENASIWFFICSRNLIKTREMQKTTNGRSQREFQI